MKHLTEINKKIQQNEHKLIEWINSETEELFIPLYTSVDLRISNSKIAPVDTNIFPAGFNNLSEQFRDRASELFKDYFTREYPNVETILIVPELHTRNPFYWENISAIQSILENVNYKVQVGIVSDDMTQDEVIFQALEGKEVTAYRVMKEGHKAVTSKLTPDLLLINNDFSEKCPKKLRDVIQPIEPPVEIGWHTRKKNIHFEFYNQLAGEVASIIDIDPTLINVQTVSAEGVNFDYPEDRGKAAVIADDMLEVLKQQYSDAGIDDDPYLFVKSNSGTYGMAVLSVPDGDGIRSLNSEKRKRMRVSKGGSPVRDVVIQEGIPTCSRLDSDIMAEPVYYLVDAQVAGGFLRVNKGKSDHENLNTRGMEFAPMVVSDEESELLNNGYLSPVHKLITCIATIAAGYEIEKIIDEGGCGEEST